ncbi:MAG TPA: hypothetical protein VK769_04750 [Verrucomicrobiae bacterium]|jgi:hypothetical protein|nr:hypothetical protein [Verrucomicrobiae bacterium]
MNAGIINDCIIIAGCAILGFVPFDKKRIRVGWAKLAFGIISIIGIAHGAVRLAWDLSWFTLGSESSRRLDDYLYMVSGVILGFLFSLILSGQLTGTKRDEKSRRDSGN